MAWLLQLIVGIFKAILPSLIKEAKANKEVKPIGHDKELQDDINASIESRIIKAKSKPRGGDENV